MSSLDAGWFWDIGNALGFVAFVGLVYLTVSSARKLHVSAHRDLGYVVVLITALHVFWLLLGDPVVVEYIKPDAPHHMWAGVIAFVALGVMTVVGLPEYRRRVHRNYHSFRIWHRWLAIGVIAGSAWHIIAAGHYLRSPYQWVVTIGVSVFACLAYRFGWHNNDLDGRAPRFFLACAVASVLAFAALKNLPK